MKDTIDKAGLPLWGGGRSGSYEALEAGGSAFLLNSDRFWKPFVI